MLRCRPKSSPANALSRRRWRDYAAFTNYLSDDAVFFSGDDVSRGKAAVASGWKPLFAQPQPPFSWEPTRVEVLDSGDLALSTGPVLDAEGKTVAVFNSIWRRDAPGRWRVVFDKGCDVCETCKH
jgi:ketosteroid isomerase-like protein